VHARRLLITLSVTCLTISITARGVELSAAARESGSNTPGGDWLNYNKELDGQRFSPLTQINIHTAGRLAQVCRKRVADQGAFEAGLIVVGDTMYATTATDTIALNARNCATRWRHVYRRHQQPLVSFNRGVALDNGRVFRGTDDARLIALDANTGKELWTDVIGDARVGEFISGAPVAWNGLVITGIAASELGIRGRIMAFDAATGREVWRFYTIPVGKDVGAETWIDTNWNKHGGGGTWSTFTVDPGTGEIFAPVGNPVPDFSPTDRPGQNLFSNCVVVLDALTGQLKWWYQTKPSDSQDHDLAAAPVLYEDRGQQQRVAAAGKDGYLHIIDRSSHELIVKTAITTVDEQQRAPSTSGVRMCPGILGGVEWNGPGFDPEHELLFVGAVDFCVIYKSVPGSPFAPGGSNMGGSWSPQIEPATGWITALDATTGAIKWRYHAEAPVLSGITPTAGGVLFGGDNAGNFYVFNSVTGEVLKRIPTGGALAGGMITYEVSAKQYVAFTSGNASRNVWGAAGRPSIVIMAVPDSGESNLPPSHATASEHGRQLFNSMCAVCHGVDGTNISINGSDLPTVTRRMSVEQIVAWVRNPVPPMPKVFPEPLQKSEEAELSDIAMFLHEWPQ